MTETHDSGSADQAAQLDLAIERMLRGDDWGDLAPEDDEAAEEFKALMQVAAALRSESQRLSESDDGGARRRLADDLG